MPYGEPVSLVAAIVVAALGGLLLAYLLSLFVLEVRQRRQLRSQGPDLGGFDRDVQRYLDRVWLLVAVWTPKLAAPDAAEVQLLWESALANAEALQTKRATDSEVSEDVAQLVLLEEKIEARINDAITP